MKKSIEDQTEKLELLALFYNELGSSDNLTEKLLTFSRELLSQLHSE